MFRDTLLMRYTAFLVVIFGLLFFAYDSGLITGVLSSDQSNISVFIIAVWLWGMGLCSYRIWEANDWGNRGCTPRNRQAFETMCQKRWGPIDITGRLLFRLGLTGTVYGFWVALSGLDLEHLADASTLAHEIGVLMEGMQIAIVTTLVGALTNIILVISLRFLEGAYQKLLIDEFY